MLQVLSSPSGQVPPASAGYRVDPSRGERVGRVASEWFSRPADQRFLSLPDLHRSVKARAARSRARVLESREVRVEARRDDGDRLQLILPGEPEPVSPTHWSFGQLASLVGAPAGYLRALPAAVAGINLQYGLSHHRVETVKAYTAETGRTELRAVTGPDYGRIPDHDLVEAVMRIAGNGTGDTRWKVPGVLDWRTMTHNPHVDVTAETTTLYASDRDVFVFLCDDANPIEAGRLPNGEPDVYFRGFYCWNSEVGARTLGIASFYLRAVCANRNLWGSSSSRNSPSATRSGRRTASPPRRRRRCRASPIPPPRASCPASGRRANASWRGTTRSGLRSCAGGAFPRAIPPR